MFCDRCGTQVNGTARFCPSCGKAFQTWSPVMAMGRVASHVRTLGMLWLAYAAMRLLGGIFLTTFSNVFLNLGFLNGAPRLPFFLPHLLHAAGAIVSIGGVLGMLAGWGLLERQPWARTLAIVLGFFSLFSLGLGTALGIYTLWVLLPAESAREYEQATTRTA